MRVIIRELIGFDDAISPDDGQKVFDLIHPELSAGRTVELDFAGMEAFASPFFNAAIGQMLRDLQPVDLNRLLRVANIRPASDCTMRQVIQNAERYYHDPDYRKALDQVLETMAEDA